MPYILQEIKGNTPLDIKNTNDNFKYLWEKVFGGNITIKEFSKTVVNMLYSNLLQISGEGNLDSTHPMYIRFYIPNNVSKLNSAKISTIINYYRIDSDINNLNTPPTLDMKIVESDVTPTNVKLFVNDYDTSVSLTGDGATQNDIDILNYLIKGSWNVIKITTDNLARITVFGIASVTLS